MSTLGLCFFIGIVVVCAWIAVDAARILWIEKDAKKED